MAEKFEVRSTAGTLLGRMRVEDPRRLLGPVVRFTRALNVRHYGPGFHEIPESAADLSFASLDLKVSEWMSRPSIGKNGGYYPGRVDFCLIWDGPLEALASVSAFEVAP